MEQLRKYDYSILLAALALVGIGIVMSYSASCVLAQERFGDPFHFVKRQSLFALVGLVAMLAAMNLPYEKYRLLVYPALMLAVAALVAVLLPGLGQQAGRVHRWLSIGRVSFQPSEAAKLALVLYLAYSLSKKRERGTIRRFTVGFLPHAIVAGVMVILLIREPDLGAALMVAAIAFIMMLLAGVRTLHMLLALIPGGIFLFYKLQGYQWERIETFMRFFMSPWEATLKEAYHLKQSCYALANGGLWGMGLGLGRQKLFFLPEPHTDFIISVIGEEWGLLGVAAVCLLFLVLVLGGAKIAMALKEPFASLLAMGIVTLIGMQAAANMAMAMGLLPTKGMALPFVSYGGSSLVVSLTAVGILIQLSAGAQREEESQ
ncbi:MAG: putative lipid II flippase FtsW [Thermodesulfobacteriota bacterium]